MFASEQIVHKNSHTEEQSKKECPPDSFKLCSSVQDFSCRHAAPTAFYSIAQITHGVTEITHDITKITHDITKITHGVALKFSREF